LPVLFASVWFLPGLTTHPALDKKGSLLLNHLKIRQKSENDSLQIEKRYLNYNHKQILVKTYHLF